MNGRDPSIEEVAAAVLDGTPVDWAELPAEVSEASGELLHELRLLWEIGAVSRSPRPADREHPSGEPASWGRYRLRAKIGGGSFGIVYRAWDPTLDREVALKIIPGGPHGPDAGPLLHEARLLARVRHPGVVTLYDAELRDGTVALSMEFVEGPTLEERLRREGSMSADETAAIGRQLCDALEAVHAAGVLHRDIKASNVAVRPDGRIALMDFGAGLRVDDANVSVSGTPMCVAPELLEGREATARSDIYSLGVLLHRLLTAAYLVEGRSLAELRRAHRRRAGACRTGRPGDTPVSSPLGAVIARATDPDPRQRYDSAAAMGAALRGAPGVSAWDRRGPIALITGLLVGAVALGLLVVAWGPGAGPRLPVSGVVGSAAVDDPVSIAVLPFAVDDVDDNVVLRNGVARDLIATLQASSQVRVVSAASALAMGPGRLDARALVEQLGARHALTGRLRRSGDRVDVRVTLVRLHDERAVWSARYDVPAADLPGLPVRLAADVTRRLGVAAGMTQDWPTRSLEAYRFYVRGQTALDQFTQEGTRAALRYFEQALAHDPDYAQAHAGIALAYLTSPALTDVPAARGLDLGSKATDRALELDPTLPEAYVASAAVKSCSADWPGAERDYRRAIDLGPGNVVVRQAFAQWLSLLGRFDEALEQARVAAERDPLSPRALLAVSSALRFARRFDEAILETREVLALDPEYRAAHLNMGHSFQGLGRLDEAIAAFERGGSRGNLGNALALAHREAEARAIIASLERRHASTGLAAGEIAQVYIGLGEIDQAFAWIDRVHHVWPSTFKVAAVWDPLRADPRFASVLKKHGLLD